MTGFDSLPAWSTVSWTRAVRACARGTAAIMRRALPQACALCAAAAGDALLCAACNRSLPRIAESCPRCALPSAHAIPCGACLASPPPFVAARAAFAYAFPVDRLLQRLKYHGALALADWAAQALAAALFEGGWTAPADTIVIALPLAPARQRERGFNQAHEIARRVAAALDLRMVAALRRVKGGPPQAALPWKGRARNVRGAFACRLVVAGRHCVLVDDIMTTGATLREATRTLLDAGAASVEVWVVARTLPPDEA